MKILTHEALESLFIDLYSIAAVSPVRSSYELNFRHLELVELAWALGMVMPVARPVQCSLEASRLRIETPGPSTGAGRAPLRQTTSCWVFTGLKSRLEVQCFHLWHGQWVLSLAMSKSKGWKGEVIIQYYIYSYLSLKAPLAYLESQGWRNRNDVCRVRIGTA